MAIGVPVHLWTIAFSGIESLLLRKSVPRIRRLKKVIAGSRNKKRGRDFAHPSSRPLPFRSLQELRRHLNYY
jgi:hypothetical protein